MKYLLPLVAAFAITGCQAVPLITVETKGADDYHLTTDGIVVVKEENPLYTLVIDGDEYGKFYYFLDEKGNQLTPAFETSDEAIRTLIRRGKTPYYKIERKYVDWRVKITPKHRWDYRDREECYFYYDKVRCHR